MGRSVRSGACEAGVEGAGEGDVGGAGDATIVADHDVIAAIASLDPVMGGVDR